MFTIGEQREKMNKHTWEHRVIKRTYDDGEDWYGIYEVYYEDDNVWSCTKEPESVTGESLEDLIEYWEMMKSAFEQPILNYEDIK